MWRLPRQRSGRSRPRSACSGRRLRPHASPADAGASGQGRLGQQQEHRPEHQGQRRPANGTTAGARSGPARNRASTRPRSAAVSTSHGRLARPSQAPAAARSFASPMPSPSRPRILRQQANPREGQIAGGGTGSCVEQRPAGRQSGGRRHGGRPQSAATSAVGRSQASRSISASASSHQPRAAASHAAGPDSQASAKAPIAAAPISTSG